MRLFIIALLVCGLAVGGEIEVSPSKQRTADAVPLEFVLDGLAPDSAGKLRIMGTVVNSDRRAYDAVAVVLTLRRADGSFVNRVQSRTVPPSIGPGEVAFAEWTVDADESAVQAIEYNVLGKVAPGQPASTVSRRMEAVGEMDRNMETAVVALRNYATAQVTFQVGRQGRAKSNSGSGPNGYCDNFRNLYYGNPALGKSGKVDPSVNLALISKAHADAFIYPSQNTDTVNSPTPAPTDPAPYKGYLFTNDPGMDFVSDFAQYAYPLAYGQTGSYVFWINSMGTVYKRDPKAKEGEIPPLYGPQDSPLHAPDKWQAL